MDRHWPYPVVSFGLLLVLGGWSLPDAGPKAAAADANEGVTCTASC